MYWITQSMGLHISRTHRYGKASPKIIRKPENWDKISLELEISKAFTNSTFTQHK